MTTTAPQTQHQRMMSRKYFFRQVDAWTRPQRLEVALELIRFSWFRAGNLQIPGEIHREISVTRSRILSRQRVSNWDLYKLWIYTQRDPGDLINWSMRTTQCWRREPRTTQIRPPSHRRRRRSTIRDVNGDVVPRAWLDRWCPDIRTQADWDRTSCYRRPRTPTGVNTTTIKE